MKKGLLILLSALMVIPLASSAWAFPTDPGYASVNFIGGYEYNSEWGGYETSGPVTVALDITPFDTTLGTLNSVTMYAEVNVSGSLQQWYYGNSGYLTYDLSNTLIVAEMGNTVASVASSTGPIGGYAYESIPLTANNYTIKTLTSGFGRFLAGPDPFQIYLTLIGTAFSSDPLMADVYFDFDGKVSVTYVYDYTPTAPVPIPGAVWLLGSGLIGLLGIRRKLML